MKKKIPRKGYRVLAIIWTLAAASVGVAFVRYLPVEFNLLLLVLLVLSTLTAANFWGTYKRTPEETGPDPFAVPPRFAENPVLFDDLPPVGSELFADNDSGLTAGPNKDSEEKNHE